MELMRLIDFVDDTTSILLITVLHKVCRKLNHTASEERRLIITRIQLNNRVRFRLFTEKTP